MPGVAQRADALVVRLGRVDVEVRVLRLGHELQVGQRRRALRDHPVVERAPDSTMRPVVLRTEGRPLPGVALRQARERGRDAAVGHLERVAGDDAYERCAAGEQCREAHHVVLDHDIGAHGLEDLTQPRLAVLRAGDECLPRRPDEGLELLDGRLAELRCRVPDELRPEDTGVLLVVGWRGFGEVDQLLFEAERFEPALPRRLCGKHHAVPALQQDVADPDALVGRPVR